MLQRPLLSSPGTERHKPLLKRQKRRAYGYLTKVVDNKNLLELVERAAAAANQTKRAKTRNSRY